MKYLKTFEAINKKTVDANKIYVFKNALIGKIDINNNDFAPVISGFFPESKNKSAWDFITPGKWIYVREATQEEIKMYNELENIFKYNL